MHVMIVLLFSWKIDRKDRSLFYFDLIQIRCFEGNIKIRGCSKIAKDITLYQKQNNVHVEVTNCSTK